MEDSELLGPLHGISSLDPRSELTLRVLSASYNMSGVYCASLSATRTAAPHQVGGFVRGQWPNFDNHCKECTRPLAWVAGDTSGGGRCRTGTFFCQSCMLTFHV